MKFEISALFDDTRIYIGTYEAKNRAGALNDFVIYMFEDKERFADLKQITKISIKEKKENG